MIVIARSEATKQSPKSKFKNSKFANSHLIVLTLAIATNFCLRKNSRNDNGNEIVNISNLIKCLLKFHSFLHLKLLKFCRYVLN